jgi:hypothetical protein
MTNAVTTGPLPAFWRGKYRTRLTNSYDLWIGKIILNLLQP